MTIPFGPVPSRRLGRSLGINHIPPKVCSYACVYCQLGHTTHLKVRRQPFLRPEKVVEEVVARVELLPTRGEPIDFLTFVPDGEPTLDINLGETLVLLKQALGLPIAVITNGSLLWQEDVRRVLAQADWVSIKVDTCRESIWKKVNRPHSQLSLKTVLDGIRIFSKAYSGRPVTETMLVAGVNDHADDLRTLAGFLGELAPERVYLSVPTRPPAEPWVRAPHEARLNEAFQILNGVVKNVELLTGYEGSSFASTGRPREDLLAMASVHPIREDGLKLWLKKAGSDWSLVLELLRVGALVETEYAGRRFYLRNLHGPHPEQKY